MPNKVLEIKDKETEGRIFTFCPACHFYFSSGPRYTGVNYCPYCGVQLEWDEKYRIETHIFNDWVRTSKAFYKAVTENE